MTNPAQAPTSRFTDRVADYVRYRPTYPFTVIERIRQRTGCLPETPVADVGSGTGIFSHLLLQAGYEVWAVEPNAAMRTAAEAWLEDDANFQSVAGTAEATTLPDQLVSLVTVAQAFHWFDPASTRREFQRILQPDGWVALIWNTRLLTGTPFREAYEQLLLDYGTDYTTVRHDNIDRARLREFFGADPQVWTMTHSQTFDLQGLLGRLRSTSYAPAVDHPRYAEFQQAATEMFQQHAVDGVVELDYEVQLFLGQLPTAASPITGSSAD